MSEKFNPVVQKISIEKFRRFHDVSIQLATPIVAIAGQNGAQKTSLLGMIAHPFSLKDHFDPMSKERDISGRKFGSDIQTKFKFDEHYDTPGEHRWSIEVDRDKWGRNSVRCVSSLRKDGTGKWRFSDPSKKKDTGYVQCPTIYLSLKRLMPLGELKTTTQNGVQLSKDEQRLFAQWHNEILLIIDKPKSINFVGGRNKRTIGINTECSSALTMSAGQDNVGAILLAVLSLRRLKMKYKTHYKGGIVLIDEIDASMFPASQVKLVHKMLEWAKAFGIQFFFTTHSEYLLQALSRSKFKESSTVVYLHRTGSEIQEFTNPSPKEIHSDMMLGMDGIDDDKLIVYSEDDVTVLFVEELIEANVKQSVNLLQDVDIGAGTYKLLFDKGVSEFRRNVIVLDGDMEDDQKGAIAKEREKYTNFVCLPGVKYPERILYDYFSQLDDNNVYWERRLGGFDRQKCFRDFQPDVASKGDVKRWFDGQDKLRNDGRRLLIQEWIKQHPEEKASFQEKFLNALNEAREFRRNNQR